MEDFELGLTLVVALASPAHVARGQVEGVADGVGAGDIVERLLVEFVDYAVALDALAQLFFEKLVGFVSKFDIFDRLSDCFAGDLSGIGVVVD